MTPRAPASLAELSPNQRAKREEIVAAAMDVLAEKGLAACTARAVAAASPLTKSAIHYYFGDMDRLIDAAMARHVQGFVDGLRAAAERESDAATAFWRIVGGYLATFRARPSVIYLWFEYWVDAQRKGRHAVIEAMNGEVIELLRKALARLGVAEPEATAHDVFVLLIGEVIARPTAPDPPERTCGRIAALLAADPDGGHPGPSFPRWATADDEPGR